jgi:error-prone DNA polymerase
MFITIEDETGVANLIVWPSVFETQRRLILSARMIACHGRVQREGEVIHVVTDRLEDLSGLLGSVGQRDGRTETPRNGNITAQGDPVARTGRDIDISDLRPGPGIRVPTRNFR